MFLKEVSYAHTGEIYLIKYSIKVQNIVTNIVIYFKIKYKFSFIVTWSYRDHSNFLLKKHLLSSVWETIVLLNIFVETLTIFLGFFDE